MSHNIHTALTIPPPDRQKPSLKVNAFEASRTINSALTPLFPYISEGCIAPCASIMRGGSDALGGVFQHFNTVDEVAVVFASEGTGMRPGDVHVGDKSHVVGSFMQDDPNSYILIVVTQRQSEQGVKQQEAFTLNCAECQHVLLDRKFDAVENYAESTGVPGGYFGPLGTIMECGAGAQEFNANVELRTCDNCGTVNEPFNIGVWQWDNYMTNAWCVDQSLKSYFEFNGLTGKKRADQVSSEIK
ncbi:hypothetical protein HBA55_02185 [Pseudomaricurvus alkylphenolicus]|uniref:hypothetical protein n=1 Tax=Pseudomaricurvus alkylphenolicus TaxID=1306991 RepID=UPI0014242FFD|nr:hypothetical protein [Pseudomaricurvus alkylphenolicus]NIB38374.1 hypothetical protein [Pseudomaricurvus alkylphenolicus]